MKKRDFIKSSLLAGIGLASLKNSLGAELKHKPQPNELKHWVWENPNQEEDEKSLTEKYKRFYDAGIRGMFFENDSEKHFRVAKKAGLEAHRWMWTMNRGEKELLAAHPDWYAVNRNGDSCATKPPYVNYYRWLCPSKPEVLAYLEEQVRQILATNYVDGIHLDYIRYCDVILPVNLWENYGIVQQQELPEYDFCYCPTCRSAYLEMHGTDPLDLEYPDQSLSWRQFRYDRISGVVNRLAVVAGEYKKPVTAAVFPTPEVARRMVRQDWTNWNLDGVCPMIYHGFYREQPAWIGAAVAEGVRFLCGRFPLYAGLFLPDFKSDTELTEGIQAALKSGAAGISFFGKVDEKVLAVLYRTSGK
ncbi:family 10 glycosylhydrolase [Gaoshiqia sediminis]|uniref:Family 10 glycosylhydrolase n=1 Tax=Gaoshiqia sediminis TaxID=2986998 RepID=A0AA41Y562_9BACT|nr:family 10 glycosylhydrolase [Gaoshiqia sediminis]MCW0481297.1 family 10 glycosylhydrolase [Gaoshiqia sediminis]